MGEVYSSKKNVYEHGIALECDEPPESLRLLATARLPIYSGFSLSIVDFNGHSLNERAAYLANVKGPHYSADYYEESDVKYCVLATLYHLNRIVEQYVEVTELFERINPPGTAIAGNISNPKVFYEIDAFLGAARRIYESISKVLWKHYHPGTRGRWSSIRRLIERLPDKIPPTFATELQKSWNTFGEKLTDYRDCVAHYAPLTDGGTTCLMNWYGNRWGMTIKLPANPAEKGRRVFDFDSGPEALSYGHSVASHLVELCESLEAQTMVHSYLANPRMD
jgi:hypothetical protein